MLKKSPATKQKALAINDDNLLNDTKISTITTMFLTRPPYSPEYNDICDLTSQQMAY
jgi:transposase